MNHHVTAGEGWRTWLRSWSQHCIFYDADLKFFASRLLYSLADSCIFCICYLLFIFINYFLVHKLVVLCQYYYSILLFSYFYFIFLLFLSLIALILFALLCAWVELESTGGIFAGCNPCCHILCRRICQQLRAAKPTGHHHQFSGRLGPTGRFFAGGTDPPFRWFDCTSEVNLHDLRVTHDESAASVSLMFQCWLKLYVHT